jgi:hypothetical protein
MWWGGGGGKRQQVSALSLKVALSSPISILFRTPYFFNLTEQAQTSPHIELPWTFTEKS